MARYRVHQYDQNQHQHQYNQHQNQHQQYIYFRKKFNFQVTDFQMWDQVLPDEQLVRVNLVVIIVI